MPKLELKQTITLVMSLLAVILIGILLVKIGNPGSEGAVVGPRTLDEPICLWEMGNGNYQLIQDAGFCARLFSQYSGEGNCNSQPSIVTGTERASGEFTFIYDGYCTKTMKDKEFIIYAGHVE